MHHWELTTSWLNRRIQSLNGNVMKRSSTSWHWYFMSKTRWLTPRSSTLNGARHHKFYIRCLLLCILDDINLNSFWEDFLGHYLSEPVIFADVYYECRQTRTKFNLLQRKRWIEIVNGITFAKIPCKQNFILSWKSSLGF